MEGRKQPEGMTAEQFAQTQRVFEVSKHAVEEELWKMACLTAAKRDDELFGETEFELRDMVHRIGAKTLENAVNQRRKKGGMWEAARPVGNVRKMPGLSVGDPKPL